MISFAGPAHEVGEHGRIIRSSNRGEDWELASDGLTLPMDDMVECFAIDPREADSIFAICSEGRLLRSAIRQVEWEIVRADVNVQCLDFADHG
jgi:hypothetical protein